jgi:hypothetical protein
VPDVSATSDSFIAVVELRILSHWEITFVVLDVVKYTLNVRSDKLFELPVVFSVPAGKYQGGDLRQHWSFSPVHYSAIVLSFEVVLFELADGAGKD